jgi:hypothetical protein
MIGFISLAHDYSFMLDDFAPFGQSVEVRTSALLDGWLPNHILWIYDADVATTTHAEETLITWLPVVPRRIFRILTAAGYTHLSNSLQ